MKLKEASEKVGLSFNILKTNIMAYDPITLWQIDGQSVFDFLLRGFRITADGDCSHENQRHLLLGRKVMTELDSILKRRGITFPTKFCLVKAMVFLVVTYGCESWAIKKVEHRIIDAFELQCWRSFLRVLCTARRANNSILKEISPEYLLETLMMKLKLQFFGHLMQRADSFEKTLMLKEIEVQRRKACQRMRCLDGITDSVVMNWVNFGSWWLTGRPGVLQSMGLQRVRHNWVTELRRLSFNFL